jgi:hypothetical protein
VLLATRVRVRLGGSDDDLVRTIWAAWTLVILHVWRFGQYVVTSMDYWTAWTVVIICFYGLYGHYGLFGQCLTCSVR